MLVSIIIIIKLILLKIIINWLSI